jgi:ankyrin repeat protein
MGAQQRCGRKCLAQSFEIELHGKDESNRCSCALLQCSHSLSPSNTQDVIAFCLERLNMNPDMKDEACSRGHLEVAQILLLFGANHSDPALSGIRPLHEAIENGHVEIVRLLISYGADPCLATYSGQLPINMAEDDEMEDFLNEYMKDLDGKNGTPKPWVMPGPYQIGSESKLTFLLYVEY